MSEATAGIVDWTIPGGRSSMLTSRERAASVVNGGGGSDGCRIG